MAQHVRPRDLADTIRDMILHTPVIDCSLVSRTTVPDTSLLDVRTARIEDDIKDIDARIQTIDGQFTEIDTKINETVDPLRLEAYQRGALVDMGQEGYDLTEWLRQMDQIKKELRPRRMSFHGRKKHFNPSFKLRAS